MSERIKRVSLPSQEELLREFRYDADKAFFGGLIVRLAGF